MPAALFIEPSAPRQNAFVESFNSKIRDELLSSRLQPPDPQRVLGKRTPKRFASFSQSIEVAFSILRTKLSPLEVELI